MGAVAGQALRDFLKVKGTAPQVAGHIGEIHVQRLYGEAHIMQADQTALVSIRLVEESYEPWLNFEVSDTGDGVLTLRATNRTVRYRVLGHTVITGDPVPNEVVLCERIDDGDAVD